MGCEKIYVEALMPYFFLSNVLLMIYLRTFVLYLYYLFDVFLFASGLFARFKCPVLRPFLICPVK